MYIPKNLLYTFNHLWLRQAGRKDVYVGITDFAQNELKFTNSLHIRPEGSDRKKGETFGSIKGSGKTFDLVMPMNGKILLLNTEIAKKPYMLNIDPYGFWLALLSFNDEKFSPEFLNAEAYRQFVGESEKVS